MSADAIGITAGIASAIILGFIAIGVAIFFGLRSIRTEVGNQVRNARRDVTSELSSIAGKVTRIEITSNHVWDIMQERMVGRSGTIEVNLKNFGKTTISARPGADQTEYILGFERGPIYDKFIWKLSGENNLEYKGRKTSLAELERDLFQDTVTGTLTGPKTLKVTIPCTEPQTCTGYVSMFLKWLDSVYAQALPRIEEFEKDIKV